MRLNGPAGNLFLHWDAATWRVHRKSPDMEALKVLTSTATGLASLAVIAFIIGMGAFYACMFSRKAREDASAAKRSGK